MKSIQFTLAKTIDELGITRNKLAVESKVRPNTISDLATNKKAQAINFATLTSILHALEQIAKEKGIDKTFDIADVFVYKDE